MKGAALTGHHEGSAGLYHGWAMKIVLLLPLVLLLVAPAHAQPELKVGQDVEIYLRAVKHGKPGYYSFSSCRGIIRRLGSDTRSDVYIIQLEVLQRSGDDICYSRRFNLGTTKDNMLIDARYVEGYRIIKPASRSEFRLPCRVESGNDLAACIYLNEEKVGENLDGIADELRYLRKEIEALK